MNGTHCFKLEQHDELTLKPKVNEMFYLTNANQIGKREKKYNIKHNSER